MAIAAIVLHVPEQELEGALNSLQHLPGLLAAARGAPERIAATIETPAANLLDCLRNFQKLRGVIDLELVYVNYEDDMDTNGFIDSPSLHEALLKMKDKS